jgi:hypothetical protein
MHKKRKIGLVGVFVLFMLFFNAPFISIPTGIEGGLPNLMLYFLIIWIVLIFVFGVLFNRKEPSD